jgi:uncharacterized damage-inducible protein DinB
MNKKTIEGNWKYFGMVLGVTRRLVEQFPEDKLDFRPTPEVRSVQELVAHVYNFLTEGTATVAKGVQVQQEEPHFSSKKEMLTWMDGQVKQGFATFELLNDEQIGASIDCWGQPFYGWQILDFIYQEHLHHRGQLTVYLRLLGIKPVFAYDFATNGQSIQ